MNELKRKHPALENKPASQLERTEPDQAARLRYIMGCFLITALWSLILAYDV